MSTSSTTQTEEAPLFHKQRRGKNRNHWVKCRAKIKCRNGNGGDYTKAEIEGAVAWVASMGVEVDKKTISTDLVRQYKNSYNKKEHTDQALQDIHPAIANHDEETERIAALIEEGNYDKISEALEARITNPDWVALIKQRDKIRERRHRLDGDHKLMNKFYNEGLIDEDYTAIREKGFEVLKAHEDLLLTRDQANQYQDLTAQLAAKKSELLEAMQRENGTWREYSAPTLNNLILTGDFESGSREWLEQRQNGIGGSDVGKIIRAEAGPFANLQRAEVLKSKVLPISDEQVEQQEEGHTEYSGYAGRGNAWEDLIVQKFAENNPDKNVTYCKSSWVNKDRPYQLANFDGLMANDEGYPDGILEIKTSNDDTKWGPVEQGLDAVPPHYRAQSLWYCDAADFKRGAVAVVLNDGEYREYHFTVTPEIRKEMMENRKQVEQFIEEVKVAKANPNFGDKAPARKGFGNAALLEAARNKDAALEAVATWREEPISVTKERYQTLIEGSRDINVLKNAMRQMYAEKDPSTLTKPISSLDLETTGQKATYSRIIEVGISKRHPTEKREISQLNKLYGIPDRAMKTGGTGPVEVHHIHPEDIAGKPLFTEPAQAQEIMDSLRGTIMLAHNAKFEKSFLSQHVPGFAEAVRRKEIEIIDTRDIAQNLSESTTNTLEAYTANFGIPYEGAHRAYVDAEMTARALEKHREKLFAEFQNSTD